MKEKEYAHKIAEITQKYSKIINVDEKPEYLHIADTGITDEEEVKKIIEETMEKATWQYRIGFKSKPLFNTDIKTLSDFFLPYIKINDKKSYEIIDRYFDYMTEFLTEKFFDDFFTDDFEKEEEQFLNSPNISDDIKESYKLYKEILELNNQLLKERDYYGKMNKYGYVRVSKDKRELNS